MAKNKNTGFNISPVAKLMINQTEPYILEYYSYTYFCLLHRLTDGPLVGLT